MARGLDWQGKILNEDELKEIVNVQTPSHVMIYDTDDQGHSEISAIQMGKNGWLTDQDGDKHRCKLLGFKESVEGKKNKIRCEKCTVVFQSERALKSHTSEC